MEQTTDRPFGPALARLKSVGLRPTRQRLALTRLLFDPGNRHVTAEQLHGEAGASGIRVSLATVYNTLHQFTAVGLLKEVVIGPGRSYFDTNTSSHHHFYFAGSGRLQDIPEDMLKLERVPEAPPGTRLRRVDVIIVLDEVA
jgi:Fur family transcriptional regulator, iron response regulator